MIPVLEGRTLIGALWALWLLSMGLPCFAQAPDGGLRAQVEGLATAERFTVSGLEQIVGPVPATLPKENMADRRFSKTARRLKLLLRRYDYVLLHDAAGAIAELRISGPQTPDSTAQKRYVVPSGSAGGFQFVTVELSGPNDRPMTLPFIVDAAATSVMLSTQYIDWLGFLAADLKDDWIETSEGRIPVKLGRLDFLKVGPVTAYGLTVAFVDLKRIGGKFLSMNLFEHFGLSFEWSNGILTLVSK